MNCPSRPDDTEGHPDWNQSPQDLSSDLTTRADLNGIVNLREQTQADLDLGLTQQNKALAKSTDLIEPPSRSPSMRRLHVGDPVARMATDSPTSNTPPSEHLLPLSRPRPLPIRFLINARDLLFRYAQFVGPGFLIAVAYIDPGNYATDVNAGASTRYAHLFIILMSNLFAIFLQSLCIKLGSVTGLNLAENCRKHLPRWLNITLYIFSEAAIIATDIAEVC